MTALLVALAVVVLVLVGSGLFVRSALRATSSTGDAALRSTSDGRTVGRGADPYRDAGTFDVDDAELERAISKANRELVAAQREEIAHLREALQFAVGVLTARGACEAKTLRGMFR